MKDFNKLAHAVWEYKYHLIGCPKYRFRILSGDLANTLRDSIRQLCEWRNLEIIAGNIQKDHIHLLLSIPPKHSISDMVGFLKGKSAIKIFDRQRLYLFVNCSNCFVLILFQHHVLLAYCFCFAEREPLDYPGI